MKTLTGLLLGIWMAVFLPNDSYAQSIAGQWKGLLKTPNFSLRVGVTIKAEDNGYSGKIDILDQGVRGMPLTEVTFADSVFGFHFNTAVYSGRLQPDGKIKGTFDQSGMAMPLDLERGKWEINRPQEPKPPFPYTIEEVKYPNATAAGVTLAGTLTTPAQSTPYPVVILISGSGANNRDEEILMHKPFWIIADYLSRHGVGVLRFDDRGVAGSTGKHVLATSADFATDVVAGVNYLKSRSDLPISKIGLLGHSEGGVIGPMAAVESADVGFLILLAGTGVRGDKLLAKQSELVMRATGAPEDEIAKTVAANSRIYEIILKSKSIKQASKRLGKWMHQQAKLDTSVTEAQMKQMIPQINNVWFRYFIQHDPAPVLEQVHCPVLALNGDRDIQVPAQMNIEAIQAALAKAGNADVTTKILPGLNHLFQHCQKCSVDEYAMLEETMAPEVLEIVGKWILEKGK